MTPTAIQLAIFVIEEAVKLEPAVALEFKALFANGTPTQEEFAALRAKVAGESYAAFVPQSELPPV